MPTEDKQLSTTDCAFEEIIYERVKPKKLGILGAISKAYNLFCGFLSRHKVEYWATAGLSSLCLVIYDFLLAIPEDHPLAIFIVALLMSLFLFVVILTPTIGAIYMPFGTVYCFLRHADEKKKLREDIHKDPIAYQDHAIEHFQDLIGSQKNRVIGDGSDFSKLQGEIELADNEVEASLRYWNTRVNADDINQELVTELIRDAQELHDVYTAALGSLYRRKKIVLQFFQNCEDEVNAINKHMSDHKEIARLRRLKAKAGRLCEDVETIGIRSVQTIIEYAARLQYALGSVHENALIALAGVTRGTERELEAVAVEIVKIEKRSVKAVEGLDKLLLPATNQV